MPPAPPRARVALAAALLVALVVAVYHPVREHAFLPFDDRTFLVENPHLSTGLSSEGLRWALGASDDGSWIPLTWLSFLVDQELHGLSSAGVHGVNVGLHATACVLLLLALVRMTGALAPSAFVAAVFAVHPLHVESVAWAVERKDVLSGLFFAALLLAWVRYAERETPGRYTVALVLLALGLLSKPMLVTAPFVLLLLDGWPLGRLSTRAARLRAVLEKIPMLAGVMAVSAVTFWSQRDLGAMALADGLSLDARLANGLVSAVEYLRKALWPADLAVFYPHRAEAIPLLHVAVSAALLIAVSAVALWQTRRRPYLLVGWLWYLGMLAPVIGVVQVGTQAMADRYTYLPLVGASVAVAWLAASATPRPGKRQYVVFALGAAATAALALSASWQLRHWRDGETLFRHALAVTERNEMAHMGLGTVLLDRGELPAARRHLEEAVRIRPGFIDAHVNLGVALLRQDELAAALPHIERGLSLPAYRRARVHAQLGQTHQRAGRLDRALEHYRQAIAGGDPGGDTHVNLAGALRELGRDAEAESALAEAERLGNTTPELYAAQAALRQRRGDVRTAVERYGRALAARPDWTPVQNNLAWLLATEPAVRDPARAVRLAEAAVRSSDDSPTILDTLAAAYHAAGRSDEAARVAARAAVSARAAGQEALARQIEGRLAVYRGEGSAAP